MATELKVPEAPAIMPTADKAEWTKRYAAAFEEAESEFGEDLAMRHGYALRAANRMLAVPKLRSLEEALKLPGWKILARGTRKDGSTSIVTIDGRKYSFPKGGGASAPPKEESTATAKTA